ncbi:hypothetical protein FB645_003877 [Coemansia sp. IMI 203386]|nr:hypothetical protein FB645_003877 [Coemansia sp. IMI 203386]
MDPTTPTRRGSRKPSTCTPLKTPVSKVLRRVEELTPQNQQQQQQRSPGFLSPFSSPALRRLDEGALRDRLRDAYQMLKEKERSLFLAATVGQELVDANQQLQDSYDEVQKELSQTQSRLRELEDPSSSRLHGRRKSMAAQQMAGKADSECEDTFADRNELTATSDSEKQWVRTHVQPVKAQLQLAQERADELLAEREELAAEIYSLRQENAAALRRAGDAVSSAEDAQKRLERLEEEKLRLHQELDDQRTFWTKRWADLEVERKLGAQAESNSQQSAKRQAEDAAARIRAEKRADDTHIRCTALQAELELLRSQMQRMEEERVSEWEPMRGRWLSCEEALQELQETHQSTCEALAQAETRLAELDKSNELSDPIKLKSEKTSTSLLGELDFQRHRAVSQQRALAQEHVVLKRAYARSLNTQTRMKQQVARLTQLAATGANEARMKRLEAALGEAECQQQALLWASMEHRRPSDIDMAAMITGSDMDGTALVTALRARLKQMAAERDQSQRELRTAHLLRANEIQRTRDIEREAAEAESKLRRALSELSATKMEYESLKRAVRADAKHVSLHNTSKHHQQSAAQTSSLESKIPQRKRTISGVEKTSDPNQVRGGPMSLNFVINSDAANAEHKPNSPSAPNSATTASTLLGETSPCAPSPKRHRSRVGDSPNSALRQPTRQLVSGKEPKSEGSVCSAASPRQLPEIYEAADRGLKTWLGTMGAAHASVAIADGIAEAARSANASADPVLATADEPASKCAAESHFANANANFNAEFKSRSKDKDRDRDKFKGKNKADAAAGKVAGADVHELDIAQAPSHAPTENSGDNSSSSSSNRGENMTVDEIYIGSRMSQKPMECNNQ